MTVKVKGVRVEKRKRFLSLRWKKSILSTSMELSRSMMQLEEAD